eukprot:684511-Rhodomonas_salina.7
MCLVVFTSSALCLPTRALFYPALALSFALAGLALSPSFLSIFRSVCFSRVGSRGSFFGDTMITAKGLEAMGYAMCIHVSDETRKELQGTNRRCKSVTHTDSISFRVSMRI